MTTTPETPLTCVVCGEDKEIQHSLALSKSKGTWVSNPVCADCKGKLVRVAKSEGRFIPFFTLEASTQEAVKRNKDALTFNPFLEKFGRKREDKVKPIKKLDRTLKIAKG